MAAHFTPAGKTHNAKTGTSLKLIQLAICLGMSFLAKTEGEKHLWNLWRIALEDEERFEEICTSETRLKSFRGVDAEALFWPELFAPDLATIKNVAPELLPQARKLLAEHKRNLAAIRAHTRSKALDQSE